MSAIAPPPRDPATAWLAPLANRWMAALGRAYAYPATLPEYLARCHAARGRCTLWAGGAG